VSQLFKCAKCSYLFDADLIENYDSEPQTRDCPKCQDAVGEIMYLGNTKGAGFYVISDDLGTKGVFNPATGKKYDSKAQYYKDVKASGMEIVGNDAKSETKRDIQGDYDCRKDIATAIEQTGAMEKLKRKK
jgi:hypothetical protein